MTRMAGLIAGSLVLGLLAPAEAEAGKWRREKKNPVVRAEQAPAPPGAYYPVLTDPFVLSDEGIFKMWFGFGGLDHAEDPDSVAMRTGYAQSTDGVTWAVAGFPALDVGVGWDRTNAEAPAVLKDESLPDGDPRKYRMYYTGLTQGQMPDEEAAMETGMVSGIGLAFSADGREFTRLPAEESPHGEAGLVLRPNPLAAEEDLWDFLQVGDPSVLKVDGRYHLWYTSMAHEAGTEGVYFAIAYATSDDGIRWVKQGPIVLPDQAWETARAEASVGRPSVVWTGWQFEMFYDAVKADKNPTQNTSAGIGFAWSADGKTWQKAEGPVVAWKRGRGERQGMLTGVGALSHEGAYFLYYPAADPDWDHLGINLMTGTPETGPE